MKQITLNGKNRTISNKAGVKSIRRAGNVPCVVYGSGIENLTFSVDEKELQTVTDTPFSHIINLNVEGKEILAILHEVQYHPVTDKALHADFLAITTDKPISIEVPVRIFGNSEGVKQGGKLNVAVRKLRVKGLVANLPDELPVDITTLKLGKRINAGDLHFEGIEIVSPKSTIVCSVRATRNSAAAAAE
ncbi:MAG: 50S ribosomal protein L25 [Bacteroidales bacterium]|nr:50S ribosomal protein L25 [Bacteroidales bacterium]